MIVRLSSDARSDLRAIRNYIARDNPRRALTFVRELRQRCEALADYPERFPLVPRYEQTGVRRFSHGKYLIFNFVSQEEVVVLHVLHGAQDYAALVFPN